MDHLAPARGSHLRLSALARSLNEINDHCPLLKHKRDAVILRSPSFPPERSQLRGDTHQTNNRASSRTGGAASLLLLTSFKPIYSRQYRSHVSLSRELPLLFVLLLRLYPVPRRCALRLTPAQTIAEWAREYSRDRSENLYRISCRHREQGPQSSNSLRSATPTFRRQLPTWSTLMPGQYARASSLSREPPYFSARSDSKLFPTSLRCGIIHRIVFN